MFDNLSRDKEKSRGNRNMILQNDVKNTTGKTCDQQRSFYKDGRRTIIFNFRKKCLGKSNRGKQSLI